MRLKNVPVYIHSQARPMKLAFISNVQQSCYAVHIFASVKLSWVNVYRFYGIWKLL